jgi:Na+-transporting methylmalonyl-CoA/oxaloacetate decarboxylase gamma subunit
MDIWAEAIKIFTFGFSSVFFVLGVLSITVVITRVLIEKFAPNPKKK